MSPLSISGKPSDLDQFFRDVHPRAVALARAYLKHRQEAEDIVSKAYEDLLLGKTMIRYFLRRVKQLCLNRLKQAELEDRLFDRVDAVLARSIAAQGRARKREAPVRDLPSASRDDQDPAAILIRQESIREACRQVMSKREFRWVKELQWWRDLAASKTIASCTENAARKLTANDGPAKGRTSRSEKAKVQSSAAIKSRTAAIASKTCSQVSSPKVKSQPRTSSWTSFDQSGVGMYPSRIAEAAIADQMTSLANGLQSQVLSVSSV
jgi:DNA-directed RNA polymerase specialized sigma24 family protein